MAAGVVDHPFEREYGGARKLAGIRQRNRICDRERLLRCLGMPGQDAQFRQWHGTTLGDLSRAWNDDMPRQRYWSSSFAVGAAEWLKEIGGEKHDLTEYIEPVAKGGEGDTATHRLHVPQAVFLRLWKSLSHARP